MYYTKFGNTGVDISSLGFGCMRFPTIKTFTGTEIVDEEKVAEMLLKAFELGVNYYDTAWFYHNGLSEIAVGKAIKGFRDKILLSTKSPGHLIFKPGDYRRILEQQLEKLQVGSIDFYHFHGTVTMAFLKLTNDRDGSMMPSRQSLKV